MLKFKLKDEYLDILGVTDLIHTLDFQEFKAIDNIDYYLDGVNKSINELYNNCSIIEPYMLTRDIKHSNLENLENVYIITYYSFYTSSFNIASSEYVKESINSLIESFYREDSELINNWFYKKYKPIVKSIIYGNARDSYDIYKDDYYNDVMIKSQDVQIINFNIQNFIYDISLLDDSHLKIIMSEFIGCDLNKDRLEYLIITPSNLKLISIFLEYELDKHNDQ